MINSRKPINFLNKLLVLTSKGLVLVLNVCLKLCNLIIYKKEVYYRCFE